MKTMKNVISLLIICLVLTFLPVVAMAENEAAVDVNNLTTAEATTEATESEETGGTCGENVKWKLEGTTLTIYGSGEMDDYHKEGYPWMDYRLVITKVVVESGVTHIGDGAFCEMDNLREVSIAPTVQSIGIYAFAHCINLTNANTPSRVTEIGLSAFMRCKSLKNIAIPTQLTCLNENVFEECTSLTEITIPAGVRTFRACVFNGCTALRKITFLGDAPDAMGPAFEGVTGTAYYPGDNVTWTEGIRAELSSEIPEKSKLMWVAVNQEPEPTQPPETKPEPTVTEPQPTQPKPTEAKATEPKATEPKATVPKTTTPITPQPDKIPPETEPEVTAEQAVAAEPETTDGETVEVVATDMVEEPSTDAKAEPEETASDGIKPGPEGAGRGGHEGLVIGLVCLFVVLAAGVCGYRYLKKRQK